MRRGVKSRFGAVTAILIVCAVAPAPSAAGPAEEEYVLELPGVDTTSVGGDLSRVRDRGELPGGIVGEGSGAVTPLNAVTEALTSAAGLAVLAGCALGAGIMIGRRA